MTLVWVHTIKATTSFKIFLRETAYLARENEINFKIQGNRAMVAKAVHEHSENAISP